MHNISEEKGQVSEAFFFSLHFDLFTEKEKRKEEKINCKSVHKNDAGIIMAE